jgi:hypothetical protein
LVLDDYLLTHAFPVINLEILLKTLRLLYAGSVHISAKAAAKHLRKRGWKNRVTQRKEEGRVAKLRLWVDPATKWADEEKTSGRELFDYYLKIKPQILPE